MPLNGPTIDLVSPPPVLVDSDEFFQLRRFDHADGVLYVLNMATDTPPDHRENITTAPVLAGPWTSVTVEQAHLPCVAPFDGSEWQLAYWRANGSGS